MDKLLNPPFFMSIRQAKTPMRLNNIRFPIIVPLLIPIQHLNMLFSLEVKKTCGNHCLWHNCYNALKQAILNFFFFFLLLFCFPFSSSFFFRVNSFFFNNFTICLILTDMFPLV